MRRRAKWSITVLLLALIGLSWSRYLDEAAQQATLTNFKRALAVAAVARGFNGVISVAQGTEVALQPVGIGVTLTVGEILDPLNDLVERFSALALMASVSLALQLTLSQMVASVWVSGLLSAAMLACLVMLWRLPRIHDGPAPALIKAGGAAGFWIWRLAAAAAFLRFFLAVVLLATHLVDSVFLTARQDEAVAKLTSAASAIEKLQETRAGQAEAAAAEEDFFDRTAAQINKFLDTSSQTLDLKAQFVELEAHVENSVEEMIYLIVVFLLQTLLLPVASLWLCWWALQAFWRWTRTAPNGTGPGLH